MNHRKLRRLRFWVDICATFVYVSCAITITLELINLINLMTKEIIK